MGGGPEHLSQVPEIQRSSEGAPRRFRERTPGARVGVWGEPGPDREASPTSQEGAPVPCVSLASPAAWGCTPGTFAQWNHEVVWGRLFPDPLWRNFWRPDWIVRGGMRVAGRCSPRHSEARLPWRPQASHQGSERSARGNTSPRSSSVRIANY